MDEMYDCDVVTFEEVEDMLGNQDSMKVGKKVWAKGTAIMKRGCRKPRCKRAAQEAREAKDEE